MNVLIALGIGYAGGLTGLGYAVALSWIRSAFPRSATALTWVMLLFVATPILAAIAHCGRSIMMLSGPAPDADSLLPAVAFLFGATCSVSFSIAYMRYAEKPIDPSS